MLEGSVNDSVCGVRIPVTFRRKKIRTMKFNAKNKLIVCL